MLAKQASKPEFEFQIPLKVETWKCPPAVLVLGRQSQEDP